VSTVRVVVHIGAPIERVFAALSDHERFLHSADVSTTIVRPGQPRDGLGCLREVRIAKRVRYLEEVTAWQPPSAFEYTIRETSLPLRHRGSRLALSATAGGTEVTWTSDFDVPIPIVGALLRRFLARKFTSGFRSLLVAAKGALEA
jgi:uncharacterized protein YndB with AHSA1/START domain